MIADLKPYAEYKESGLPWLGQVPGHWEVETLRRLLRPSGGIKIGPFGSQLKLAHMTASGFKVYGQANVIAGDIGRGSKYVDEAKFDALRECEVQPGDLLITMMGTSGRCMVVPNGAETGLMDSHLLRLRLRTNGIDPVFTALTIDRAPYVKEQVAMAGKGSIMHGLNSGMVKNLVVAVPPPAEQAAIVRFLDWANGRLERAIRAKRKVIALLGEQKQAIIHRAVTRGLDPSVPLKPSGIPWLGDIPQHWEVVRNMALFAHRVEAGRAGFPVLQISLRSGITAEELDQFGRPKRLIADATKYKLIHKGDVAYNTMRMWQGAVGVSPCDGLVSPAYVVLRPRCDTCPEFYDFIFHTEVYKQEVNRQSTGIVSDRNRLYWDSFKQMPNIHLPRDEQAEVVTFILSETSSLNTAISRLEREIELLREYRTRLVADVVTGKLDVREAALRLPDEAPPDTVEADADLNTDADAADEEAAV